MRRRESLLTFGYNVYRMVSRTYLNSKVFNSPVKYPWDRRIANKFLGGVYLSEEYSKLWNALSKLSFRACYALSVACTEWAVMRFGKFVNMDEVEQRIEASWAATLDYRYAKFSEPEVPKTGKNPDAVLEGKWLSQLFLKDLHDNLSKNFEGTKTRRIVGDTLAVVLLVRYITPKPAGFDKWLTTAIHKARKQFPQGSKTIDKEDPVAPDFFDPEFKWSKEATLASQSALRARLDPTKNPFLKNGKEMQAAGFTGEPYPH